MKRLALVALVAGCTTAPPPAPPARDAVTVEAGFDATWDAAIDYFAASNMPISNMDRASGFVRSDPLRLSRDQAERYANCGLSMGLPLYAERVSFNILVRAAGVTTTVRVTSRYSYGSDQPCTTKGVWEGELEAAIKESAEAG